MTNGVSALGAKCVACGHVWIVGYAPIELGLLAELGRRAMCPKCGNKKPNVAKDAEVRSLLKRLGPVSSAGKDAPESTDAPNGRVDSLK